VALVTGAGSGMGRAICARLAQEGARIFAVDVDADRLAGTEALVAEGRSFATMVADVSDPAACRGAAAACAEAMGGIDVLGNVAGIARANHLSDVDEGEYHQVMAVNAGGCFFMTQAALPHLLAARGNVVNIASTAGMIGQAYMVPYCMSKGAVISFTRALAMEFTKRELRVNAIAPGGVVTNLTAGLRKPSDADPQLVARYSGIRSPASPEDIAALFAFLASDEARDIHGSIVVSDHGTTAG
jgi:NAD(P)-dependent dehydrogenase (short-subunit alcohol dehydrogenase family)